MSASGSAARSVAVVGGGITGLTAAYWLCRARRDLKVTLFEQRPRLGGNILTERWEGFLMDAGPDSFLATKPDALALCEELGLRDELITTRPEAHRVYLAHQGRLQPLPEGMALGVPTRLAPFLRTPILTPAGKLRALGDVLVPRRDVAATLGQDESILEFMTRRVGREAARRIVGPLLGGIYAGDIATLSIQATFPELARMETRYGSLMLGLIMRQRGQRGNTPFRSLRGGMATLVHRLEQRLPPESLQMGVGVERLEPTRTGWRLLLEGGRVEEAHAVVLTVPAHAAAALLPDCPLGDELRAIPYASTATVFFAFPRDGVHHPLDGAGFIVPTGEARILASTWVTSKWEGRAPNGQVLVRAFVGGTQSPVSLHQLDDRALMELSRAELERLLGPLPLALFSRAFRYHDANPQPVVGHIERLIRIDSELRSLPGLYLAGAAYRGVGIPDCIRQARAAAERLLRERW